MPEVDMVSMMLLWVRTNTPIGTSIMITVEAAPAPCREIPPVTICWIA